MNIKKKIKSIAITSITIFSGIGVVTASLAWFLEMTAYSIEEINLQANSGGAYFAYGSGVDEEHAYGIASPRHLYNLAWMQYLGMFEDKQYYFELANDVDMTGYYLPPIGTEAYPFLGHFDGQGYAITGLNVTNDYSDFTGYSQAPEEVITNGFTSPQIVGFFGVVGKLPTTTTAYTYNSQVNSFTNTTLNSITIHGDGTNKLLTGLAAGYASATMQNVKVGGSSTLNVNGQTATEFTDKLTDYGLVGYSTQKGISGIYSQELSEYYDGQTGAGGDEWGGSVAMKDMYTRLNSILNNNATSTSGYAFEKDKVTNLDGSITNRNAVTGTVYTYNGNNKAGSFVFSRALNNSGGDNTKSSNYIYLNGGTTYHLKKQVGTTVTGFTIYNNSRYLGINSSGSIANTATVWFMDGSKLAAYANGKMYYLKNNVTLSTSTSDTWTKSGSQLYYESGWLIKRKNYLYCNNGSWTTERSEHSLTLATATTTKVTGETSNGSDYMDYTGTNVTYFPLITAEGSNNAAQKNTGYVIGGSEDKSPKDYPDKTGDIRVSKYTTNGDDHNINNSYNSNTKQLTNVYTINASLQTVRINESSMLKYADSKTGLLESIADNNMYGLHFMSANISASNLVTASYALINGQTKSNYKMPASSIDFKLSERGIINFFAGTYFSASDGSNKNNSFFSLHKIERNSSDTITGIKEIKEIYKSSDARKDYIYKYMDNSTSATITSDYSLTFATSRIKKQSSVTQNAVYYFEIPVNAGEFALGSVSGGTGAYLMYLDIGTNGVPPDPVHAYWINTKTQNTPYPIGVDFCPVEVSGNGGDTFGIYINSGKTGSLVFTITTANVSVTDSSSLSTYSYKGLKFTDNTSPSGGTFNVSGNSPGQLKVPPVGGTRVLMIDLTNALDSSQHFTIRITDYLTNTSGSFNESESVYEIDNGTGYITSSKTAIEALSGQIKLNTFRSLAKVATLTRSSGVGEFVTTYDMANCKYKEKIVDVDIEKNGTTISLDIASTHTFKIGGTQYSGTGVIY